MADQVGSIGARLDLQCRAGSTLGPFLVELQDSAGAAISLVGATLAGTYGPNATAMTITVTDAANGKFSFSIAAATTDGFIAPGGRDGFWEAGLVYSYLITVTWTDGTKEPLFFGEIQVASKDLP